MHDIDPQFDTADNLIPAIEPIAPTDHLENSGRKTGRAKILGALVVGGIAGAAILGPLSVAAASPTPSAATTPTASGATTTPTNGASGTDSNTDTDTAHTGGPGGSGHTEAVTDTSVVAKAIGITEAELKTALAGGQTVAAVANAHNVALQTVIDALVADGTSELAAQVAGGSITQAQADAEKADLVQRATDQANGTFSGGRH